MNIGDFNLKELGKNILKNNPIDSSVSNFIKELSNSLEKNKDKKPEERISNSRRLR